MLIVKPQKTHTGTHKQLPKEQFSNHDPPARLCNGITATATIPDLQQEQLLTSGLHLLHPGNPPRRFTPVEDSCAFGEERAPGVNAPGG